MPYLTREDGERFIIPSYRDVLSAKKPSLLKKEIMLLTVNYGEYITLQKKGPEQYEVAFSHEPGALLGENVWQYFKRPRDLIYCEAIPNTSEAILVIVKSGSVYLDGTFPLDNIAEELIIFQTQQNNFDIYIYGDVPISKERQEHKFSFDPSSVHSFTVLERPVFPTLPVVKAFQLQLVDVVLKSQGIGIFPLKKIIAVIILLGLVWFGYLFISTHKKELPQVIVGVVNPYQLYIDTLTSPNPSDEIKAISQQMTALLTISGWFPANITYANTNNILSAQMKSYGARTSILFSWAAKNNADIDVKSDGFYINIPINIPNRYPPMTINQLNEVIANLTDRLSYIIPGNPLTVGDIKVQGRYKETDITITFADTSISLLTIIGQQLRTLPLVLTSVDMTTSNGNLSGTIVLKALGN